MAKFEQAIPKTLKWEGGWVNDPDDPGGATNRGVIFLLFKKYARVLGVEPTIENLKALTADQASLIFKDFIWDRVWGDQIVSQPVANLLFDTAVNLDELKLVRDDRRGSMAVKMVQEIIGFVDNDVDGKVGPKTIGAINRFDPKILFDKLKSKRIKYYEDLAVQKPKMQKFLNGWLKRVNDFHYE